MLEEVVELYFHLVQLGYGKAVRVRKAFEVWTL